MIKSCKDWIPDFWNRAIPERYSGYHQIGSGEDCPKIQRYCLSSVASASSFRIEYQKTEREYITVDPARCHGKACIT